MSTLCRVSRHHAKFYDCQSMNHCLVFGRLTPHLVYFSLFNLVSTFRQGWATGTSYKLLESFKSTCRKKILSKNLEYTFFLILFIQPHNLKKTSKHGWKHICYSAHKTRSSQVRKKNTVVRHLIWKKINHCLYWGGCLGLKCVVWLCHIYNKHK